jgi:hypothetical protein
LFLYFLNSKIICSLALGASNATKFPQFDEKNEEDIVYLMYGGSMSMMGEN